MNKTKRLKKLDKRILYYTKLENYCKNQKKKAKNEYKMIIALMAEEELLLYGQKTGLL